MEQTRSVNKRKPWPVILATVILLGVSSLVLAATGGLVRAEETKVATAACFPTKLVRSLHGDSVFEGSNVAAFQGQVIALMISKGLVPEQALPAADRMVVTRIGEELVGVLFHFPGEGFCYRTVLVRDAFEQLWFEVYGRSI